MLRSLNKDKLHIIKFLDWDVHIVTDLFPVRSSLTGIHAGLFHSRTPYAFFAACDIPFLKKEVVKAVIGAITPDIDAVIPETAAGFEPLCLFDTLPGKRAATHDQKQTQNPTLLEKDARQNYS